MHLPNAFLLTFTTYGGHLPGDPRGWCHHARGVHPPSDALLAYSRSIMRGPVITLDEAARAAVLCAVRDVCEYRRWPLRAAHVRTQHAHVVAAGQDPDRMIRDYKAYSTRALRANGIYARDARIWADGGSAVPLWTEREVEDAARYVYERQGEPMARFGC